ncbi:putative minor capsid protein [Streptococcus marmotae]|uniref:putative minor capsid protein n=1 Tax=Streptococcus marmotae TaxID=1825069 RepID=UPI00082E5F5A|nr:putative minor capsid protein [Streptococcus marmotae]
MIAIDKRLLVDSVIVKIIQKKDDWGKETYQKVSLSPVRFDRKSATVGTANQRSWSKSSTIFVYTRYCSMTIDDSWLNAIVDDGDREYKITSITPVYYPHNRKIFSYEIEVV